MDRSPLVLEQYERQQFSSAFFNLKHSGIKCRIFFPSNQRKKEQKRSSTSFWNPEFSSLSRLPITETSYEYSTLLACFKLSFHLARLPTSSSSLSERTSMTQMQRRRFCVGKGEQSTILLGGGLVAAQRLLVNSCLFVPLMAENDHMPIKTHISTNERRVK